MVGVVITTYGNFAGTLLNISELIKIVNLCSEHCEEKEEVC